TWGYDVLLRRGALPETQHGMGRVARAADEPLEIRPRASPRALRSGKGPGGEGKRHRPTSGRSANAGERIGAYRISRRPGRSREGSNKNDQRGDGEEVGISGICLRGRAKVRQSDGTRN